ncbi:oligopeptidase A [Marinobacterium nitratireducens]|uniref:oligopeptidase A n=1 Tax=Marinobacterium nitratireducens TaxID=518897 RepID=A0A917Z8L5_9GAMM|nr:oligopeptidase A [Marinobacterium nitratireducens]GGO77475.1 oligopeptidase A [Marinobacterium nitratireducens]
MSNPLLQPTELPAFSTIRPEAIEPAIDELLARNRERIEALCRAPGTPDWASLVAPLEQLNDELSNAWSPVSHLNSVVNEDKLREAYNACLPKLSQYWTELGQNQHLFEAFGKLGRHEEGLDDSQRKVVENTLRDFRLSGIALDTAGQQRYAELQQRLSKLTTQFSENVLDATNAWSLLITDEARLSGLPPMARAAAKQAAEARGQDGWLVTLDFPSYFAVITHADDRELRQQVYRAYMTRASELGADPKWDNSAIIDEILTLRHELAHLLGFANYAEYSLATKMAESPQQVVDFLEDLAEKSRPEAQREFGELCEYARREHGMHELQAWDVAYFSEKLKQARYEVSQEELRPYFPLPKVLDGLFQVAGRLFDVEIAEVESFDSWHRDARLFEVSRGGTPLARFYLDPFARERKRGGAWMDTCRIRRRLPDGALQLPVAYLVCNFTPAVGDDPALLTHNEVTTLFHEFGHGLHHMLTQIDYADVSGINGVAWDAVELPSQFLENWCWEPEALALISGHYQTGAVLPEALLEKMLAAKNFQSGMFMVRQLEFALFDFVLHRDYVPGETRVQSVLDRVREQVSVVPVPAFNRFQHGFSHIFAGGYAAGYYSYKWAEVLSADAFSRFEEEGIFNPQTGADFRRCILEAGGSREPMELFVAFRGREPSVDALLRHSGIA